MIEKTLIMVKPDATAKNLTGRILAMFEEAGLRIVALKTLKLTELQARRFYKVHQGKPFYESLVKFMSSGKIVASVLEGDNAIAVARKIMGATNPKEAEENTIRRRYGTDVQQNAVHGSDSKESAEFEIGFFFSESELLQLE